MIKVVGFCSTFKHCTLVVFLSLLNLLICNVKSLFCNCFVVGAFDNALLCSLNLSYAVVEELSQNPADPVVSLMGAPLLFFKRIVCLECPLMCSHNTLLTKMSYTAC